jgi:thioredoxin reductase (NADPH)
MYKAIYLLMYVLPIALAVVYYLRYYRRREQKHVEALREATEAGLTEPPSLHPVIDPVKCVGSRACLVACPEQALGFIDGKAVLINAAHCIGHGACKPACPHGAIELVFGTAKRGMDIPQVKPNFETNVPGIYIAGELGGMGLVRKAAEQGRQAMESIAKLKCSKFPLDVVIVGAGPAGMSASLTALHNKLRFVTVEQEDSFGGTVYHYPRNKIVMTAPVELSIIGKAKLGPEILKEELLKFWEGVLAKTQIKVQLFERVEKIAPEGEGFVVKTSKQEYRTRAVLLAMGRRGTPRKLGVPGEEQPKVVYRLIDAEQYRGQHVLVVGGGDSALEAAISCAAEPGTHVILSYRSEAFGRVKAKNRERLAAAEKGGRLKVMLESNVKEILPKAVKIEQKGSLAEFPNDAVIVCAGGILPNAFLKEIGILVETRYGTV